jgi:hypothetical protein
MAGISTIALFLLIVVSDQFIQGSRIPGKHKLTKRSPFGDFLNYDEILKQEQANGADPTGTVFGIAKKVPGTGAVKGVDAGDSNPVGSYYESFTGGAGKQLPVAAVSGVAEGNPLEQYYGGAGDGLGDIGKKIPVAAGSAVNGVGGGAGSQSGGDDEYYNYPIEDKKDDKMARLKQADELDDVGDESGLQTLRGEDVQDALKKTPRTYNRFYDDPVPSIPFDFKQTIKDGVVYFLVANDGEDLTTLKDIIVGCDCINSGERANIHLDVGPNGKHTFTGFGGRSASVTCNGEDPKFICKNDNGIRKYDFRPTILLADGNSFMVIVRSYRNGKQGCSLYSTKKGRVSQTVKEEFAAYVKQLGFNPQDIVYFDHTGRSTTDRVAC